MNKASKSLSTTALPPSEFNQTVIRWQSEHGRNELPWQLEQDPYHVLVSEFMLQQTQVATVIPYFTRWLHHFPTLATLASASEDEVLTQWQGLGFYRRARNLHKAAQYLQDTYQGQIPAQPQLLQEVPGIGPYTAGAITAFAFNQPAALVDGNVKRVFCRYFGIEQVPTSTAADKLIWQLAESYYPEQDNRSYAQGLLDLGATICTPRKPNCISCPLRASCYAYQQQRVDDLPTKPPRKTTPTKPGHFIWISNAKGIFLTQRSGDVIWPRLWSFPEVTEPPLQAALHGHFKHTFSHYKLAAQVWQLAHPNQLAETLPTGLELISWQQLKNIALPTPIKRYLDKHQQNPG
ncbi:A/G-specific adenine glycosylase [Pseudidiomarina sp. WS423]|uniref:A/G-specific adenine glycosylase n=1 Tax=Pseudidiomarina sp. WS423 TaxID=3425124 RepID=UPI003D6EE45B